MEFKCYEVIEIQGKRYVIIEKIAYKKNLMVGKPLKDKLSTLVDGSILRADSWCEYGLKSADNGFKRWLTIENDQSQQATLSDPVLGSNPPEFFKLVDQGVQQVNRVVGDSLASFGDIADYWEYEHTVDGKTYTYFKESWHEGKSDYALGEKIPLSSIRVCADQAANALSKKARKQSSGALQLKVYVWTFLVLAFIVAVSILSDMSWHSFRSGIGFPYTMEEYMEDHDVSYVLQRSETQGPHHIYHSNLDPTMTAIQLLEAIDGNVYWVDLLADKNQPEVFISTENEMCMIYAKNGLTYVDIGKRKEVQADIEDELSKNRGYSHILQAYARLLRGDEGGGWEALRQDSSLNSIDYERFNERDH